MISTRPYIFLHDVTIIQMANSDNSKVVHSSIRSHCKYLKILGSNTLDRPLVLKCQLKMKCPFS